MAASTEAGSSSKVSGSMSANTGIAPKKSGAAGVATNVYDGTITSSPYSTSSTRNPSSKAHVPLTTAIQYVVPWKAANSSSNASTCVPELRPHTPNRNTSNSAFSSTPSQTGQVGNGAVRTGVPPSRASFSFMCTCSLISLGISLAASRILASPISACASSVGARHVAPLRGRFQRADYRSAHITPCVRKAKIVRFPQDVSP